MVFRVEGHERKPVRHEKSRFHGTHPDNSGNGVCLRCRSTRGFTCALRHFSDPWRGFRLDRKLQRDGCGGRLQSPRGVAARPDPGKEKFFVGGSARCRRLSHSRGRRGPRYAADRSHGIRSGVGGYRGGVDPSVFFEAGSSLHPPGDPYPHHNERQDSFHPSSRRGAHISSPAGIDLQRRHPASVLPVCVRIPALFAGKDPLSPVRPVRIVRPLAFRSRKTGYGKSFTRVRFILFRPAYSSFSRDTRPGSSEDFCLAESSVHHPPRVGARDPAETGLPYRRIQGDPDFSEGYRRQDRLPSPISRRGGSPDRRRRVPFRQR